MYKMYELLKADDYYEILNEAPYTIRKRNNKKVVNIRHDRDGYTVITLSNQMKYLHKILAIQFIPNPFGFQHVRFIDGDKNNLAPSNLKWCSRAEINKTLNRVKRKTNEELKEMNNPINLSRSQLRRWNKIHNIKDVIEIKYCECDSHEFDGFILRDC